MKNIELKLYFTEFLSIFDEYYSLLLERYDRFRELRESEGWSLDTETYLDMIIVQIRSIMIDKNSDTNSPLKNYTVQNVLSYGADETMLGRISDLLETVVIYGPRCCEECLVSYDCDKNKEKCCVGKDCTVYDAIKIIADKSICHYDNFYRNGAYKPELIAILKKMMFYKNESVNIDFLIGELNDILNEAFGIGMELNARKERSNLPNEA